MTDERPVADSTVPHAARIWNYWLGGKDNYLADRRVAEDIRAVNPAITKIARARAAFLGRALRFLAADAGIRQYLDIGIGIGLPAVESTHEIVQRVSPEARVTYVDHDPLVLAHARAMLTAGSPDGAIRVLAASVCDPDALLERAEDTLDFTRPIALKMTGVTTHITDDDTAYAITDHLVDALPRGSHLVLCDYAEVVNPEAMRRMNRLWNKVSDRPRVNRTPERLARFFRGLTLLDPGLVSVPRWRPDTGPTHTPEDTDDIGGVARKD